MSWWMYIIICQKCSDLFINGNKNTYFLLNENNKLLIFVKSSQKIISTKYLI